MQCTNPYTFYDNERAIQLPCGRCLGCRIARSREWTIRLMHEFEYHAKSAFVTLTYEGDNLPVNGGLIKPHLQAFFKRLRKYFPPESIKYYGCGEYGERNGRPHYHAIIFGCGLSDRDVISKAWGLGFTKVGTVTYDSCRYTADYIMKSYNGDKAVEVYGDKQPPFRVCSNGIGKQWAIDHVVQLDQRELITMHGAEHGIPKYYGKVLGLAGKDQTQINELNEESKLHAQDLIVKGVNLEDERHQIDLNYKARINIKRKGVL